MNNSTAAVAETLVNLSTRRRWKVEDNLYQWRVPPVHTNDGTGNLSCAVSSGSARRRGWESNIGPRGVTRVSSRIPPEPILAVLARQLERIGHSD
jgi:hypothetical protein